MTAGDVTAIVALYRSPVAAAHYDEAVTQVEHALQCAELAAAADAPDALVVAALLHDIGHLLVGSSATSDRGHEGIGSRWLRPTFGPEVTAPIALHVDAKRYLCAIEPGYVDGLSDASVRSLGVQGGPMTDRQVRDFEARRGAEAAVRLRRWDDRAKVSDAATRPLEAFVPLLHGVAAPSIP